MKKTLICVFTLLLGNICPLSAVSEKPTSVLVIGGGPAGLSTAIEAAESGARVTIIEKRKSRSRAQTVFLLDSTIKLLEKWKVDVPEMAIADLGNNDKFGFVSINRLEEALEKRVNELGIKILHGEFQRLDQQRAVIQTSHFEAHILYDILVAADGMHSRVREELSIPYKCFGKAIGIWTSMRFSEPSGKFDVSPPIEANGFFIRKISVSLGSIIFAQSSRVKKISQKDFESLIRECGWQKEADAMAKSEAKISGEIEIALQQAQAFSSTKNAAILVGDAAAAASFFQGMGANTAFKTAAIAGDFFKTMKLNNEDAHLVFNQKMKETTDLLIEDSQFLF